ncbi:MAG: AAA family ATPase [Desulfobacterales bacterium]|nr:AAA family ATPase [Desulfobacterales bacterium]
MKIIAFFNIKGGVGQTTLVYHIAWMMAELGHGVLAADLDPQANLTSMFLEDGRLEEIWSEEGDHQSILSCIDSARRGIGDIAPTPTKKILENLHLIPGDLGLSRFEDKLSDGWARCLDEDLSSFRAITAFYRAICTTAEKIGSEIVLIDVGPNLGAITRSALLAADHVVTPLAPDLYSLQGLQNVGPTLEEWRRGWKQRLEQKPVSPDIPLPAGGMPPAGYIIIQPVKRMNRPAWTYQKWMERIPVVYDKAILSRPRTAASAQAPDAERIGLIRHYRGLMLPAREARKPIFLLKPAEGAIGAHSQAVWKCYMEFKRLTETILQRTSIRPHK